MLIAGCSSTVESRIQARQEIFDAYPADVQARLQRRQIHIGDDMNAVWIAFGEPSERKYSITDAGRTDIWVYKYLASSDELYPAVRPIYRDINGRIQTSYYIDDTPQYVWKESLRVEFKKGRVSAITGSEN